MLDLVPEDNEVMDKVELTVHRREERLSTADQRRLQERNRTEMYTEMYTSYLLSI